SSDVVGFAALLFPGVGEKSESWDVGMRIFREDDTLFALWLMWVSSGGNGTAKVCEFDTIDVCKEATASAVHVGAADSAPKYSFLCVQIRSEMRPGGNG